MSIRLLATAMILAVLAAIPAAAQQDPIDLGLADSLTFVIQQPQVGVPSQVVTVQLYTFNDVQTLTGGSAGFSWDNPKLVMESVTWTQEAIDAFDMTRLALYRNRLDSTNRARRFQLVVSRMFNAGFEPSLTRRLVYTCNFRATDWTASDKFCISLEDFNAFAFVDENLNEYPPIWAGPYCVGFNPTGLLEVDSSVVNFSGVAGGAAPPSKTLTVTEHNGQNITFAATDNTAWITLNVADSTTPGTIAVNVNPTGLAAGDYSGQITITSAAAVNQATVTVNLHLAQPNRPPVLNPIGNRSTNENQLLQFIVTASDPDGITPTLTTTTLPAGASFVDNHNGTGSFSWTPTYVQAGSYPVTFTASDALLADTETITITVNNVNRPPVLAEIGPRQVLEGANLNFGLSGSDPDLTALTFSAVGLPTGASLTDNHNGTATFNWTPSNTQSGSYDVRFVVSDGNLADSELVNIQVIDADGFVVDSSLLSFEVRFNGPNPGPRTFRLEIGDGSHVPFTATTAATWFTVDPTTGTTPFDITISINSAGLAAGLYRDSIQISELLGGNKSTEDYVPIWVYVNLEIKYEMSVAPDTLYLFQSEGDLLPASGSFQVTELGGGNINFAAATGADWFHLNQTSPMTPGDVFAIVNDGIAPGEYFDSVNVSSTQTPGSARYVYVHLLVTPCPQFSTSKIEYNFTIFGGETATVDESFTISSTTEDIIPWIAQPHDNFTFDPSSGSTEGSPTVGVMYSRLFENEGVYADTARITDNWGVNGELSCHTEILVIVNVTVNRPPSADTVIVVNTPAVPGMRVGVPVTFTNSCPLTGLGLSLNWTTGMHLDSVSFVGGAIAYVNDKMASINNDLGDVTITMSVGEQTMVPRGSEQLLGTLYFALPCEIEAGTYNFGLGASPPLTPADVYFNRNCGEGVETEFPIYIPGAIIVGTASNYVCGYVVDPFDNAIDGATVELWDDYPFTEPLMSTHSSSIGGFAFDEIMAIPFDLYAYKEGYYPGKVEDINFGDKGIKIVLQPLPAFVTETTEWVDYFCPETEEGANLFLGVPVPVGAYVEAYTQNGLLVGQTMVRERGKYGFMHVYRADDISGDPGARGRDILHFSINGMDAIATGITEYPEVYAQIEVCLEVRGTIEKACTLFAGWNLISWNVNTESDDILNVLAPIMDHVDVVLGFERGGLTFDPDLPMFSDLWKVDHLSGYWVRIEGIDQIDLTISGLPVVETTPIPLTTGWNLVSYLREESWPVETALANVDHITRIVYGFPDRSIHIWVPGGMDNDLATFDPCNGYWIKTSASGTLIYNGTDLTPADFRPQTEPLALGSGDAIATTSWVNLYSSDLTLNGEQVTAGSTVTAHALDGDKVVGSFTLKTNGQFGFMPVYADAAGENAAGLNPGDEFYLVVNDVKTEEVFTWSNNGDRIEVTQLSAAGSTHEVLPSGYSLEQNYPNPFNPNTVIKFGMPVAGHARIEVFSVLGTSVTVIFDGLAPAGEHEVVWDGRDDAGMPTASGVYFYRLTADNYTETMKMMLLK